MGFNSCIVTYQCWVESRRGISPMFLAQNTLERDWRYIRTDPLVLILRRIFSSIGPILPFLRTVIIPMAQRTYIHDLGITYSLISATFSTRKTSTDQNLRHSPCSNRKHIRHICFINTSLGIWPHVQTSRAVSPSTYTPSISRFCSIYLYKKADA